ncbi:uncharacterized protein L201_007178 [Kwoniella dendrophila CBS 6074]|uniref:Uncharacterized protein n=1 Tax=Kwoniella dendrophila CBS 6074 TaxID=1295534 RepID=A0AAX4K525_9TREE
MSSNTNNYSQQTYEYKGVTGTTLRASASDGSSSNTGTLKYSGVTGTPIYSSTIPNDTRASVTREPDPVWKAGNGYYYTSSGNSNNGANRG